MTSLNDIRQQASGLEIDVEINTSNHLNMHKRGATDPRFASLQDYDAPGVLVAAKDWLDHYRIFVYQLDQVRK